MMRLLVMLLLVESSTALAREASDTKPAIDPSVSHVESGGQWRDRDQRGHYRVVTYARCSPEHCYNTLAVDWVALEAGHPKVVSTKSVSEVGGLTQVTQVRFVVSKADTRLEVKHETFGGEDRWAMCLTLGTPGKYLVKNGTCRNAG